MKDVDRLEESLAEVVARAGLYMEKVELKPAGKRTVLRVTVDLEDGPGGVDSDQIAEVSREVSRFLDESPDAPSGQYLLEVSTPGATRPLTEPRHFRRAQGRRVIITTVEGEMSGRLVAVETDRLTLNIGAADREIALVDVVRARMDVEL
ncbi:ribosome maturation factor RimP [Flaviflexus huanghaiensis]|uniref:ribosome maturation factor RimP n=1 Tax=Flaviflexus huanghaiensis TaxID=1111473 RepID=UPI0015F8E9E0|nr:ribosome maturation factor RimP [Flaviflexus huanghaiensis]